MHPAASVIFFTTASGAGYGMLALIGILAPLGLLPTDRWFAGVALLLALGFVSVGLLSSTFHLHHPERAWRAFSQWRSSWLSREGVLALATYGPAALFAFGWIYLGRADGIWALSGVATAAMAMVTVFSTSMIYASLKTIRQWRHRLVPPLYLILAVATGAVWLLSVSASFGAAPGRLLQVALAALILAALLKLLYWRSIDQAVTASDAGTATGLGTIGAVRQLEAPHSADNWVLREMGFVIARKHSWKLRRVVGLLGFVVPLAALGASAGGAVPLLPASWLATLSVSIAVFAERWLFFADARHVVGLYYGRNSV